MSSPGSMELNIPNEWAPLQRVVVGHGLEVGEPPNVKTAIDPISRQHLLQGTYPAHDEVKRQLDALSALLESTGVEVLRPVNLPNVEQIFTRDIGMVIDHTFIRSRTIDRRSREWDGIAPLLDDHDKVELPEGVQLEGGDLVVLDDALIVGVTRKEDWIGLQVARTLPNAVDFLRSHFPEREVMGVELHKDDHDPLRSALHLDCAYMPLGGGEAILCPEAFVEENQFKSLISKHSKVIEITLDEAALLQSNLLHIDPETLLIDPKFRRLGVELEGLGYRLMPCPYDKVGRMGGLFRCTTLPLLRKV